jgi:hypothetical protein
MMRDLTSTLRRQLQQVAKKAKLLRKPTITLDRLLRLDHKKCEGLPLDEEDLAMEAELERQRELQPEQQDALVRLIAELEKRIAADPDAIKPNKIELELERRIAALEPKRPPNGFKELLAYPRIEEHA